jgi:tryptophan synthase beta chain
MRAEYVAVPDAEAVAAFRLCARLEGIMPALEPAHAIHQAGLLARGLGPDGRVLVCLSGRGDKDMDSVEEFSAREALAEEPPALAAWPPGGRAGRGDA